MKKSLAIAGRYTHYKRKRMRAINFIVTLLVTVSIFSSCTKDDGLLTGDAIGFVRLFEVNGGEVDDKSGVTVSVDGKNLSTTTDVNGRYKLSGLTTGTYNLTFTKSGYGTDKRISVQFIGGDQPTYLDNLDLSKIPSYTITGLVATTSATGIDVRGTFSDSSLSTNKLGLALIFVGKDPNVSSNPANYLYVSMQAGYSFSTTLTANISTKELALYGGISKGQTIYIIAYSIPERIDAYLDLTTGRYYYTALGPIPSNVVSVVIP